MNLVLYSNFNKRVNSTKLPTGGTVKSVTMKRDTSISSPVFLIDTVNLTVNYCRWENRYYFIDDIVLGNNKIYELHCRIDVLATWKESIGNSIQYVTRSGVPGDIVDSLVTSQAEEHHTQTTINNIFQGYTSVALGGGTFMVCIAGAYEDSSAVDPSIYPGGVPGNNVYYMSATQFYVFCRELSSNNFSGLSIPECSDNLSKALVNPFQYILYAKYIPISFNSFRSSLPPLTLSAIPVAIKYGWFTLSASAWELVTPQAIKFNLCDLDIPKHPYYKKSGDANYYNLNYDQLLTSNYIRYKFSYPMVGEIDLNNDLLSEYNKVNIYAQYDPVTAKATIYTRAYNSDLLSTTELLTNADFGIDLRVNNYMRDSLAYGDLGSSLINAGIAGVSGNLMGVISSGISAIQEAYTAPMKSNAPAVRSNGNVGGFGALSIPHTFTTYWYNPTIQYMYTPTIGQGTCKYLKINELTSPSCYSESSIIKCYQPAINTKNSNNPNWFMSDYNSIISYLTNGFYYE